ncbi:hypothetical protein ACFLU9_01035 [Chloroflexota bacterium]
MEALPDISHELSEHEKDVITRRIAKVLEQNHHLFSDLRRIGYNPIRIAHEAYKQTREDLQLAELDTNITLETEPPDVSTGRELDKTNY